MTSHISFSLVLSRTNSIKVVNVYLLGQDSCCLSRYYVLLVFKILFIVLGSSFASFEVKCETLFVFRVSCTGQINQCMFSMLHRISEALLVNRKKSYLLTGVNLFGA